MMRKTKSIHKRIYLISMSIFRPDLLIKKYDDLDIEDLKNRGFDTVFLDVDNTITPYFVKIPDAKAKAFVQMLKDNGFHVIVVSNNTDERVKEVASSIDCEHICWAFKPLPFKANALIKKHHLDKSKVFIMGDQLLTDVLCGKLTGIYAIYVKPISEVDSFTTKINRKIERFIFKHILHEKV